MKGVLVVQDGELCAVLHEHPDEAEKALSRIKAEFDVPKTPLNEENIFDHLLKVAPEGSIVSRGGILESGNKLAREIFKETYLNSYVAHAPIETHTAVAKLEKGKIMVWASTQSPFGVKEQIASSLGIPSQNVRVIAPFLGGRVRRKELQHASLGGSAIGKIDGKAGARRVEPCRGVLL
jgi:nicotinate dehydrogenase subunit B